MKNLFKHAGALPFLIAVFLNAFVDLGHKIVIQNTIFKMYDGKEQVILTAIINGLILLPFILLFSPAGHTSDRYPKHAVMQKAAWAAVFLTVGITVCYAFGWFWIAFAMTFLLAAQSAFYSPAKFGYIRGFFGKQHLAEANGVVSAISIIAILSGTLVFSILFESMYPEDPANTSEILTTLVPIGVILVFNSIVELVMMYRLPQKDYPETSEAFDIKAYASGKLVKQNLQPILQRDIIRLSIIGLAMFWSIGQVMLASFPAFAKEQTGEVNTIVIQAILASTGLGIAIGSIIASRVSKNYIETGLIPIGAAGIAIGLWVLPTLTSQLFMGLSFLFIGTMGGMFIVPLNAMIQFYAEEKELGKVLAGNNLIQNISMLFFLVLAAVFAFAGISSKQLLFLTAIFAVVGGCYTVYKLPQSLVRFILSYLMSRRYRVNVQGMKNIPSSGGVLLLGNHISWIDWAIVQIASPRPVQFVMLKSIYERWYLTWFFKLFGCVPIEQGPNSKNSLNIVTDLLNQGNVVCLFPEGTLSRTGHLAEFRRGYEHAAQAADENVVILPFYLRGLWGSQFSRSSEKLKHHNKAAWKRDIVVAFGEPIDRMTTADVLKRRVFDLSISSWQSHANTLPTLAHAWIETSKRQGSEMAIADTTSEPLSALRALTAAIAFSKRIKNISPEQNIGLLVPTSAGGMLANMATLLLGKTIVNLNYTASTQAVKSAIEQAEIKTVYTSKKFLKKLEAKGIDLAEALTASKVIYLEDIKSEISKAEFVTTFALVKILPSWILKPLYCRKQNSDSTAAILFSSGSEGAPKGIKLSHVNFMANLKQISDVLNMEDKDVVMASLPLFHAFGLTVTQFLPLIEGLPLVCHPDPTDVVGISKAVAKYRATIMCGTSTFLRLYCRNSKVHPLMLNSLRVVISGAEKLNPEVRQAFKLKFNKDIFEGYGATETTPVAGVNLPDSLDINYWKVQLGGKIGTVGMPLPGTSFKIVDPETWQELPTDTDGMILIGGAQVMQGYLNNTEKTEEVIKYINNTRWYVTGDKGRLDSDGFLTIVDRYSRFAKLGGEMISLAAVENAICSSLQQQYPELEVVAINLPDDKKGEKIILLSDIDITLADVKSAMIENACNTLMIPSQILRVETLPKLGTGKTDFSKAKLIAKEAFA
ncbi:acyl-[ACP]--phospholipid O-acyltransferase [Agarilytica rhodophyticola]|uniref:acyl-[ACP]--phospholipid O-acyltransferase n=1 Tax=Agarilytica rhodophyticola TaxID=1737490 RepID=UPI000B3425AE|nr:acyl-[ACP]--phospholipid O-acyltransferase [Agarilytica rhodophyticola]